MSTLRTNTLQTTDSLYSINIADLIPLTFIKTDLANAIDPAKGAALVGYKGRTVAQKLGEHVSVKDFGAVGDGITNDQPAIQAAIDASQNVYFPAGEYYLATKVVISRQTYISAHGASVKGLAGGNAFTGRAFEITGNDVVIDGLTGLGNQSSYFILTSGKRTTVTNCTFRGTVGHFVLAIGAGELKVLNNTFDGEGATEITTCVVLEGVTQGLVGGNSFTNVPVGWGVQVRQSSSSVSIVNNNFHQFRYTNSITATAGQTVFNFTLGSVVNFKGIQINGKPLSKDYTTTGTGPAYTVTFAVGRSAGEVITLVGYRGAENVQLNTSSFDITVSGNTINGTGDSGIVVLADRVAICGNIVKNAAYAGIAIYGDQNNISITGNIISDCSQLNDGLTSPDNPALSSVFTCGILLSGLDVSVVGNVIVNDSGTMLSGIRVNKLAGDDFSSDKQIKIGSNSFRGTFAMGRVSILNDSSGQRIQSVEISDGLITPYPEQINLDAAWTTAPTNTAYYSWSGFGGTQMTRDTTAGNRQGGVATMRTLPGEYIEANILGSGMMVNQIIKLDFWAKNSSGSSYVSLYTTLAGLPSPVTATITDTSWKQYTLLLPLTANLSSAVSLRVGGNTGAANFQHFNLSMIRV